MDLASLPAGGYTLELALRNTISQALGAPLYTWSFTKSAAAATPFDLVAGIGLYPAAQTHLADCDYGRPAAIFLPRGTLSAAQLPNLRLYENGSAILASFDVVRYWDAGGTDVAILHVNALWKWRNGAPLKYRVAFGSEAVSQTNVDISTLGWLTTLLANGPSITNAAGQVFTVAADPAKTIVVEAIGPSYVVFRMNAVYYRVGSTPFANCQCRVRYDVGSPLLQFEWIRTPTIPSTIVSKHSFTIATSLSASWENGNGVNPMTAAQYTEGLEGWAANINGATKTAVLVRDFVEKFPQQIEIHNSSIDYNNRPGNLGMTFGAAGLTLANVNKWLCFHEGNEDLTLPTAYYDFLAANNVALKPSVEGTALVASKPEYARDAIFCGQMIDRFAILLNVAANTDTSAWFRLFDDDPPVMPRRSRWALSGVLGPTTYADASSPLEDALAAQANGFTKNTERCGNFGWLNYGDYNEREVVNSVPRRSDNYRDWNTKTHYGGDVQDWLAFARTQDTRWLQWARKATQHHYSIDMVRYDALPGGVPSARDHWPGCQFHVLGWTHQGFAVDGLSEEDTIGYQGHFITVDAFLLGWLLDGDRAALDAYNQYRLGTQQWFSFFLAQHVAGATPREFNHPLDCSISFLEQFHDATLLPFIYGTAAGLRATPMLPHTGPLSAPLSHSRYWELTHDAAHASYIVSSSTAIGTEYEVMYAMALAATAFTISGDVTHLTKFDPVLAALPASVHRDPDPLWDGVAAGHGRIFGPGPLGDKFGPMQIGRLQYAQLLSQGQSPLPEAESEEVTYLLNVKLALTVKSG